MTAYLTMQKLRWQPMKGSCCYLPTFLIHPTNVRKKPAPMIFSNKKLTLKLNQDFFIAKFNRISSDNFLAFAGFGNVVNLNQTVGDYRFGLRTAGGQAFKFKNLIKLNRLLGYFNNAHLM
jgi:hypothetical protein